jgi:hypothetical protein
MACASFAEHSIQKCCSRSYTEMYWADGGTSMEGCEPFWHSVHYKDKQIDCVPKHNDMGQEKTGRRLSSTHF